MENRLKFDPNRPSCEQCGRPMRRDSRHGQRVRYACAGCGVRITLGPLLMQRRAGVAPKRKEAAVCPRCGSPCAVGSSMCVDCRNASSKRAHWASLRLEPVLVREGWLGLDSEQRRELARELARRVQAGERLVLHVPPACKKVMG